jgi:hypothetical protein
MTAQTLPLRSLIKFSGLTSANHSYDDLVSKIQVTPVSSEYQIDFMVSSNYSYVVGDSININRVTGLADISRDVEGKTGDTVVSILGVDQPSYSISSIETYSIVLDITTYYYLKVCIGDGHTMNAGSTVSFANVSSPLDDINGTTQTIYSSTSYTMVFRTTDATPFGIDESNFPLLYIEPEPPNTFPEPVPNVLSGGSATVSVESTNGYITSGLLVSTLSPVTMLSEGYLTDHNRAALDVSHEEIEKVERTVDGTLRYHHSATKKRFRVSWKNLPADAAGTVDGYWSGAEMLQIFRSNKGTFYIEIYNRNSAQKTSSGPQTKALVRFADLSYSIVKRNFVISGSGEVTDLWDIDITLEEV